MQHATDPSVTLDHGHLFSGLEAYNLDYPAFVGDESSGAELRAEGL